jgi:hypothetical protein
MAKTRIQDAIDSLDFNVVLDGVGMNSQRQVYTRDMNPIYSNAIAPIDEYRRIQTPEEDLKRLREERLLIKEKLDKLGLSK